MRLFLFLNLLPCNETEREMVEPSKLMMRVRFPPPAFFSVQGFSAQSPCIYSREGSQRVHWLLALAKL